MKITLLGGGGMATACAIVLAERADQVVSIWVRNPNFARDMATLHPELSLEMAQVVRRTSAGMARDRALQGLWVRTGVEELRALVASMIQCERLGTSIARVLRINAESLRLRRRQHAEKRAAEAALKMIFPLALFLLPALMVIIIGPAFIEIMRQLGNLGRG